MTKVKVEVRPKPKIKVEVKRKPKATHPKKYPKKPSYIAKRKSKKV